MRKNSINLPNKKNLKDLKDLKDFLNERSEMNSITPQSGLNSQCPCRDRNMINLTNLTNKNRTE